MEASSMVLVAAAVGWVLAALVKATVAVVGRIVAAASSVGDMVVVVALVVAAAVVRVLVALAKATAAVLGNMTETAE